ncbi:hypothetical protein PVAP13_7KG423700 [Panicum virgatum]|uniref:Wall-associated receptor kinase galacturonan-binding domain-containing protein n=1 Tax=Panicum virgatum TaxID=38727 RepID=A0A8T0QQC7_PANVG|nr:hypothetical protein PVAP13_7KG423700 [Panicum virgatum]
MMLFSSTRSTEAMISVLAFLLFILTTAVSAAAPVALPGCPETCGNITVPYPFGTRPGCFREGFNLTCEETPGRRPKLLVGDGVEVFGISLPEGTLRVHSKMLGFQLPTFIQLNASWSADLMATGRRLVVSTRHNRFAAMGCNLLASLVVDPDAASDSTRTPPPIRPPATSASAQRSAQTTSRRATPRAPASAAARRPSPWASRRTGSSSLAK